MSKTFTRYWLCQFLGWGVWGMIIMYFNLVVFGDRFKEVGGEKEFIISLLIFLACGILTTHLLRTIIKRTNWLRYSFNRIALLFLFSVGASGILLFYGDNFIEYSTNYSHDKYVRNKKLEKAKKIESQYNLSNSRYYEGIVPAKDSVTTKAISEIKKNCLGTG